MFRQALRSGPLAGALVIAVVLLTRLEAQPGPIEKKIVEIPKQPPEKEKPGNAKVDKKKNRKHWRQDLDYIDDRAPHDDAFAEQLEKAIARIKDGEPLYAMMRLEKVLAAPPGTAVCLPDGRCVSAHEEANRILLTLPEKFLRQYRQRNTAEAKRELEEASGSGNLNLISQVASSYFHTDPGKQAANMLASMHLDRGEYGLALRWLEQIDKAKATISRKPFWRVKFALALRRVGKSKESDAVLKQLTESLPGGVMTVAGERMKPADWLRRISPLDVRKTPIFDDWITLLGSPQRRGSVQAGTPLLMKRWTLPLTGSRDIRDQIRELHRDIVEHPSNYAAIPAFRPLAIKGKIVHRTFRGVQVVDAESGRVIWEAPDRFNAESLLSRRAGEELYDLGIWQKSTSSSYRYVASRYNGGSDPSYHALTSFLYRNALYGSLGSDGKLLYVLEDQVVLSNYSGGYSSDPSRNDRLWRDWKTNSITAYDLETGQPAWQIGGKESNEPFAPQLTGWYFFGSPVRDGEDLFVIGERNDEIHLLVLDPATGHKRWSLLLSFIDPAIYRDMTRRFWSAPVSVGGGILICPTTSGWLMAVDRTNRKLLWTYRYSDRQKNARVNGGRFGSSNANYAARLTLNGRWGASAPIIAGNKIIYTPSEAPSTGISYIHCIDLHSGKRIWRLAKNSETTGDTGLFIAGVMEGNVIVAAKKSVRGYDLETGKLNWTAKFPLGAGPPSGFGVHAGNTYYLPMQSGQLWGVDPASGKVRSKFFLPPNEPPLGNLMMYRGGLYSLSPMGLVGFEQRETIEARIAERLAANSKDAWALLRKADMLILRREFDPALKVLKSIERKTLPADQVARFETSLRLCLIELVQDDLARNRATPGKIGRDDEMKLLEPLMTSEEQKLSYKRLQAARLLARADHNAAFDLLMELAESPMRTKMIRGTARGLEVRLEDWTAGQLRDVWIAADKATREKFDIRIREKLAQIRERDPSNWARGLRIWEFHPACAELRWMFVEQQAASSNFAHAEAELLKLRYSANRPVAAAAIARLVTMYRKRGLEQDALFFTDLLRRRFPKVTLPGGRPVSDVLKQFARYEGGSSRLISGINWNAKKAKITRMGTGYYYSYTSTGASSDIEGAALPFFRRHRFQIYSDRLRIYDDRGKMKWMVGLSIPARYYSGTTMMSASGHTLYVVYRGVLQAISIPDRKVLWVKPLETRSNSPYYRSSFYRYPTASPRQFRSHESLRSAIVSQWANRGRLLAAANERYALIYGFRKFQVLDAQTGEIRWSREQLPSNHAVFGTSDLVFEIERTHGDYSTPSGQGEITIKHVYRAMDGKKIAITKAMKDTLANAVFVSGSRIITLSDKKRRSLLGFGRGNTYFKAIRPVDGSVDWQLELPAKSWFAPLADGRLVAGSPDRTLRFVNPDSGKATLLATLPGRGTPSWSRARVLADRRHLYLIRPSDSSRSDKYSSPSLASVMVEGTLDAFDLDGGRHLWRRDIERHYLITAGMERSPVLIFLKKYYRRENNSYFYDVKLEVWGKDSGKVLAKDNFLSNTYSFRSIKVNSKEHFIDIRNSYMRIRIEPGVLATEDQEPLPAPRPQ